MSEPIRKITEHAVGDANNAIQIDVMDPPGAGGANHQYLLALVAPDGSRMQEWHINFQNGPIKETGHNGLTQEALLAVVIDRLKGFDGGPFRSRENSLALTHCQDALHWLQHRTRERQARGVEGTNQQ